MASSAATARHRPPATQAHEPAQGTLELLAELILDAFEAGVRPWSQADDYISEHALVLEKSADLSGGETPQKVKEWREDEDP
jgi:hypothetical protein